MEQVAAECGFKSPEWQGWLLLALTFEPDPISAETLRIRSPYTSPRLYAERLENAANGGFLVAVAEDKYRLTELGRRAARHIIDAAYAEMATLHPLPSQDLERLADLLRRLVFACLSAPEPPGKWCIAHSRRTEPEFFTSIVARIDQYLSDLASYRDDAHLAAWQTHDVCAHAWEALTYLWRGEAATLDELCAKLGRRGRSPHEYRQALQELVNRGWIEEETSGYRLTPQGLEVRQSAEELTDRYFYAPWGCLDQEETEELRSLLSRLRDALLGHQTAICVIATVIVFANQALVSHQCWVSAKRPAGLGGLRDVHARSVQSLSG